MGGSPLIGAPQLLQNTLLPVVIPDTRSAAA
jgi:hypothetical protein